MLGMHPFRNHSRACQHKKDGRKYFNCDCPIWIAGLKRKPPIKSLFTRDPQVAYEKLAVYRGIGGGPKAKEIPEAIQAWDEQGVSRRLKPPTLKKYRGLMVLFQAWCKAKERSLLLEITVEDIEEFRKTRDAVVGILVSINELQTFRSFFRYANGRGWTQGNPAMQIRMPKAPPSEKIPYTPMEMSSIIWACDRFDVDPEYVRPRAKAMILLMRYTGLRISDVIRLRRDRVRDGMIMLYTKKTGQPVTLPLPGEVLSALEALPDPKGSGLEPTHYFWHGHGNEDSLDKRAQRLLRAVFKKSGVKGAHSHRFRHTLASDLAAEGRTLREIANILGISQQIAEKHYVHWTPRMQEQIDEAMRAVFKKWGKE